MKRQISFILIFFILFSALINPSLFTKDLLGEVKAAESGTPLSVHGALHVSGTDLYDESGNIMQLHGVSTHGLSWFPEYVNYEGFKTLRDDWGANVIRLALYTREYNGYLSGGDKASLEQTIHNGVSYATDLGMYVIIDWHILSDGNPNQSKEEAKDFFNRMSARYSGYKNVIYEICNEPNGGVSWDEIRSYANEVIPVIHNNSPDAVILCGTPTWSQDVDSVIGKLPNDTKNVMYSLHFYAATHGDYIRQKVITARDNGIPVFISEFSICDASGNGWIDYDSAGAWFFLIDVLKLSYVGWNLSNKNETSSLIRSGVTKLSGWSEDELSDTGRYLRTKMRRSLKITPGEEGSVYRLYFPGNGEHFYTLDVNEGNSLIDLGWRYEGIAFKSVSAAEGIPVYRLYSYVLTDHFYTTDENEKNVLSLPGNGFTYEGVGFYAPASSDTPIYRLFNPNALGAGTHHYTKNPEERDFLINLGWKDEKTAWYGL